jgi:hypothetical protein
MIKVISFSLWGDKPIYNIGAIKNAECSKEYYPDFECWFYIHLPSVPKETISELQRHTNVKLIFKEGDLDTSKPRMWRFEPIDNSNVSIMLCRDTDTRILLREKLAVDEWINSNKLFHIMRDHPYHSYPIQAGMFGMKKNPKIISLCDLILKFKKYSIITYDQEFLEDIIYPIIKHDALIHASFCKLVDEIIKPFPISYDEEFRFVGEYINHDETGVIQHRNMIKTSLENKK